ncbi:secreted protein [Rhodopirellula maiorica SM1]|uniref:Secreted protein n=1 Tax=Rhodopirellula maiorica SM1 TaxID=1265738 RepID=M5RME1_9BACT|nr:hypothetical protein [Rhodopirellula maiorica]EMI20493.1 secreted protein [Rhodopirellula maiorica SM1]
MKKFYLAVCVAAGFLLGGNASSASAQQPAHYYPARPTFSPYMFYRQFNGTGLPNYYTFVRPREIYRDYITRSRPSYYAESQRQRVISQDQVSEIVDNQIRERLTTGVGMASQAASFQNTSHYYPRTPVRRR